MKAKIRSAQIRVALAVNKELINFYLEIGKDIVERQESAKWGSGFIEQMSKDLKLEFSEQTGYGRSNLFYMRKFYLMYKDVDEKVQRLVGQKFTLFSRF